MASLWRHSKWIFFQSNASLKKVYFPATRCYSSNNIIDGPDMGPHIPPYKKKQRETSEIKKARLLYQSRKRGMLENGLILSTFADKFLNKLNGDLLEEYDTLINEPTNDWDIYYWIIGAKETPEEYENEVMKMLKKHAKNENMESRIRQPDLKF